MAKRNASTLDNTQAILTSVATQSVLKKLHSKLKQYLPKSDIAKIRKACDLSIKAHQGQTRESGEPYVHHPIQVASLMADLHLDAKTITAGVLHDVIEDTPITHETLVCEFGGAIADIVDGVSKIDKLERCISVKEAQASSLQKMILAMAHDLRVILVKLIDRLHNMRTLESLTRTRQRRIARETLEVYAAIAYRLGMDKFRRELEDRSFAYLYPMRSRIISNTLERLATRSRKPLKKMHTDIAVALNETNLKYTIGERNKSAYSVYRKMVKKHLHLSVVTDIFGFRIIVPSVDDCYRTLGILHNLYKPVPGKFKDYIALPKANGYQSLHTVLFGMNNACVEVQIRTEDMDAIAENGIASHHLYKIGEPINSTALIKAREWVASLTDIHKHTEDSQSFIEGVKHNLYPNDIYVFTPQGRIHELPVGSTAMDFAFAVHTNIGLSCSGARIDNRLCAANTPLKTGQTVEIITSPNVKPDPRWLLRSLATAKARTAIQYYLKKMRAEDAEKMGRNLLEQALSKHKKQLATINTTQRRHLLKLYDLQNMRALYHSIGTGEYAPHLVAAQFLKKDISKNSPNETIMLENTSDLIISYGHCCYPIPGDKAIGIVRPGHGFTVHRQRCPNVSRKKRHSIEIIPIQWPDTQSKNNEHLAAIRIEARHERGVLAIIAGKIAETQSNIENVSLEGKGGPVARLLFILNVADRAHLDKVIRRIRNSFKDIKVVRVGLHPRE